VAVAELLTLALRGERCTEEKDITVGGGNGHAILVCDLKPGHPGPLHYDHVDRVWWSVDKGDDD
jgi:hypothetical protein